MLCTRTNGATPKAKRPAEPGVRHWCAAQTRIVCCGGQSGGVCGLARVVEGREVLCCAVLCCAVLCCAIGGWRWTNTDECAQAKSGCSLRCGGVDVDVDVVDVDVGADDDDDDVVSSFGARGACFSLD